MTNILKWKKNSFTNKVSVLSQNNPIGILHKKRYSQVGQNHSQKLKYIFKSKGVLKPQISIVENVSNETVGKISVTKFTQQAIVTIENPRTIWKIDTKCNFKCDFKWTIKNDKNTIVVSSEAKTFIMDDSNIDKELLLIAGLFIDSYNHYLISLITLFNGTLALFWVLYFFVMK